MLEREIQEKFVDFITAKIEIPQESTSPMRFYKELIHYRFDEVIRSAMP